jgi:uncharacterized glyoxalase superfamily protein PhnB
MSIHPALRYRDAHAAVRWLQDALGFEAVNVYESGGRIAHAELAFGDGIVMLSEAGAGDPQFDRTGGFATYLATPNVDAVHERARAAGASFARAIQDMDYGSREFTVTDPEGNFWSVGTYVPRR